SEAPVGRVGILHSPTKNLPVFEWRPPLFLRNRAWPDDPNVGTRRAVSRLGNNAMKKAIAIGMLGLALASNRAAAQTAVERAQILRDFQQSVVDYTQQHECLVMFPEAASAATPAPKVFTLPVAMVFR